MSIQRSMVSEYVWRAVLSRAARAQRGAAQAPQQRCLALSDALHVVSCNRGEKSYFKDWYQHIHVKVLEVSIWFDG